MGPAVPLRTTTIVLVCACIAYIVTGNTIAPRNVRFHTLNLNLSILWSEPFPDNIEENEVITYTVFHQKRSRPDKAVSHCVNITRTGCYLVPLFPTGEFEMYEYFYVKSRSSLQPDEEVKSYQKKFYRRDVEVSAPVIYNTTITTNKIVVSIHGPETPFYRDGSPLYMGDTDVGGSSFYLDDVKYMATLFLVDDPDDVGRSTELKPFRNGLGRISFDGLYPYTTYLLQIWSKLNRKLSSDVTDFEFLTDGCAPDVGPVISGHRVTRRYCDYRDVEITWKEMENQRSNGPLTEYIIRYISDETNETGSVTVSASNVSVTLPQLIRWDRYDVMVSSANQYGSTRGQRITIEPDYPLIETYEPKIDKITKMTSHEWKMTWEPPEQHNQCIVGYMITTHIDGDIEEEISVYGVNSTSAILHFSRTGRYQVELRPLVNDSVETKVFAAMMYNANAFKIRIREWSILAGVAFLLLIVLVAVIFMTWKVFCDTSALPDINKSRSMKLVNSATSTKTLLKKPPEKEHFDETQTKISTTIVQSAIGFTEEGDDDVFQPKTTSTSQLLSSTSGDNHSLRKRATDKFNTPRQHTITASFKHVIPPPTSFTSDESEETTKILDTSQDTEGHENINPSKHDHGYVARARRYKCTLSVKIPAQRTPHLISSPSSSSDSGISASTYVGSVSDYAPSPPLSGMEDPQGHSTAFQYNFQMEPPYVSTQVAVQSGRLKSTSVSSDVGSDCPAYNRIDSRLSFFDPYPKGYLTMEPARTQTKRNSGNDNETTQVSSTTLLLSPYSKLSPKK